MTRKTLPRYLTIAVTLSTVAIALLLLVFYGQSRWLGHNIVRASVEQHDAALAASFERRARSQLHKIADSIVAAANTGEIQRILNAAVAENSALAGIRYDDLAGTRTLSGDVVDMSSPDSIGSEWTDERLFLDYAVVRDEETTGTIASSFLLAELRKESFEYRRALSRQERQQRRSSFLWIGSAYAGGAGLFGLVVWLVAKSQSQRIDELKIQAKKLSDADFGEPLAVKDDDLGELAQIFNDMREKLQLTTISRDYVDDVLSSMNEAVLITSEKGTIRRINPATTRMLGYTEDELVGLPISHIVNIEKGESLEVGASSGVPREAFLLSSSGKSIPVSYTGSVVDTGGAQRGDRIYAAQNITDRRRAEQRIRYLARIDALTKVPNRMQFQHLLQRAIARAKRSGRSLWLLYVDIDHFKEVNDTFGHLAGDTTLETVAERLIAALPPDTVIGRLAGDEFAVIVDQLEIGGDYESELDKLARATLDQLAEPFEVQGSEVFMTASMGIACYPIDAPNVIDLIRNADAALYQAKKNGGNVFCHYAPEMNDAAVERLMTKSKLKRAFERDELLVHYQPKYNIETGEIAGAEALVRWELPERGMILPSDFIPIAEETHLIIEIGEWVLDRVCEDFKFWQRSVASPGRVSVNLSLKQLRQPNFISRISSIMRSYEVSPTSLELEITETTLMEDPTRTIKLLDELYSLGLHLAIDDFGTGYSSLSALQQFPISTLKIDQSFVRDVVTDEDDATIVGTIIHMGRSLKMDVVAEGVETEEQLNVLQSMQCNYVQGLLFGNPMSSDNFLELLLAQAEGTNTHQALFI